jgi:hypothetical protein
VLGSETLEAQLTTSADANTVREIAPVFITCHPESACRQYPLGARWFARHAARPMRMKSVAEHLGQPSLW